MNPQPFSRTEEIAVKLGYVVTSDGRVISPSGKVRKTHAKDGGYLRFRVNDKVTVSVSRLQAFIKFGAKIYEPGMQVRHLDGNPANNAADNIEIGTSQQNAMDKSPDVRMRAALKASSYVKRHDHTAIFAAHKSGLTYDAIRQQFGITSLGTVSYIVRKSIQSKRV